ncbi:jg7451 [Pararge aegeria aegeria]|uniref:Jg7451 protein n=1 Tax=Pararge aegeria aegeria TaxID=348720 RepID=A0A8S4QYB4_9NEOP|nr:jg7451 [Pararge aegeria aegeria]
MENSVARSEGSLKADQTPNAFNGEVSFDTVDSSNTNELKNPTRVKRCLAWLFGGECNQRSQPSNNYKIGNGHHNKNHVEIHEAPRTRNNDYWWWY